MNKLFSYVIATVFLFIIVNACLGLNLWEEKNKGLIRPNYTMNLFEVKNEFWLCTALTLYKSTNFGDGWIQQTLGLISGAEDLVHKDSTIVLSISSGEYGKAVMKSTNLGQTWINKSKGLGDSVKLFNSCIEMKENFLFLGSISAVMRCSNMGDDEWEKKSNYVDLESWKKPMPKKILSIDKYLFIADNNNGVWASTDLGENWYKKSKGLSFEGVFDIQCFDNILYASTFGGGINRSYDWGENWERITPKDSSNLREINTVFVKGNTILASTYRAGIYISTDAGQTWKPEEISDIQGLNYGGVGTILEKDGYIYACFKKLGIYQIKFSYLFMSVPDGVWEPITKMFPNPATDKITIEVEGAFQKIHLSNVSGKIVQIDYYCSLTNDKTIFDLNTSLIPRGTYFYAITNGTKEIKGKFNKY